MELAIQGGGSITVSDASFDHAFNETLVHQVVVSYLAGARSGTKAQKTRSEVRGGGAKPWRQKGSGRARAGTIRSPLWRGGGATFAAKPRDYSQKINRKMYRGAMRAIFSELFRQQRIVVVEDFSIEAPKTKALLAKLKELDLPEALIITEQVSRELELAARNIPSVGVIDSSKVNPVALIGFDKVLLTVSALKKIEEWLV